MSSKTYSWLLGLVTLAALSLNCSQSSEAEKTFSAVEDIEFSLTDGVDDGFEGYDMVSIQMTKGTADTVTLVMIPEDQSTETVSLTSTDNITFEANVLFGPYQTEWFISASSSTGATTEYGASNDLITSQKYLNKTNADQLIFNVMNEKRSDALTGVLTYEPNSLGNTHTIQVDINGTLTNVELDHYSDILNTSADFTDLHAQYAIEYNTSLDSDNQPITAETNTYQQVSSDNTRDMGYIIIASTDQSSMEFILSNPTFLKDGIFLSELSGDNLQLIQY